MSPRIGVHLGTLRGWGSGVVGRSLLNALLQRSGDYEFVIWVPQEWRVDSSAGRRELGDNVRLRETRGGLLNKLVLENVEIRRALRRDNIDCLFSTGDTSLVACSRPHLLLVQQAYLAYPQSSWRFPVSPAFRRKMHLMSAYLRAALPTVSRVTVQSQHMKAAFSARWSFPAQRIDVIPSAIASAVAQGAYASNDSVPTANERPYLAYITSAYPHKNHQVLLPMLSALVSRGYDIGCKLSLGAEQVPQFADEVRRLGLEGRVEFCGQLSIAGAAELTRGASVVVIPSKLESFGIIYYEAMAAGRPIVATDASFSREALGDTALYADGDSGDAWAGRVAKLLDDAQFARGLGERARNRFEREHLAWSDIASAYLEILQKLC